jgi:SAM-dependent methyltransferase
VNIPLLSWQKDLEQYALQIASVYQLMNEGMNQYCGGLERKTILEIGTAHQLPHGGLNLALAIRDGARQAFGVDITHPEMTSTNIEKVNFWRVAKGCLGIECDGLEQNRVGFWNTDTLHYDDFYQKIIQLQMSASNMYFKDGMFDIVFSNAVLEHVKNPREIFSEMYRVMAPGGYAYHHWNPYTSLEMGGHDIGIPYYYPWAHLRLSEAEHIAKLRTVLNDPMLLATSNPAGHTISPERAENLIKNVPGFYMNMMDDLNKIRVNDLIGFAEEAGFEVIHQQCHIHEDCRKYLTREIRNELKDYSEDELLGNFHSFALFKPLN